MSKLKVCSDQAELGKVAGQIILAAAAQAIKAKDRFVVAFSGGSLPSIVAPFLVANKDSVEWDKWVVVFADERVVEDGSADLNLVECTKALLGKVPIPSKNIIGINVSDGLDDVSSVATKYEAALKAATGGTFSVDLALLGMGPDGHTCSLFPNHQLLEESKRYIAPITDSPKPPPSRVTFTLKTVHLSKQVVFITAGASKADVLPLALKSNNNPEVPSSCVRGADGFAYWFVDEAAAAKL